MFFEQLFRFVFVLYCTTVGVVLLLAPWTPGWEHIFAHLPGDLPQWTATPLVRGATSGFGLVHLLWAAHDLADFLQPPAIHPSERPSPELSSHAHAAPTPDSDQ